MSDPSPSANPAPPARAYALPWWLPGLVLGLLALTVAVAVVKLASAPTQPYKAHALIHFQADEREGAPQPWVVQQRRFLVSAPDILARVVADPAFAQIPTVQTWSDPAAELKHRLVVEERSPYILEVSLAGDSPDDLKAVLEHLVKRYVIDCNMIDNKVREERRDSLERVMAAVQQDLNLREKNIDLVSRSNGVGETRGVLARLNQRFVQCDELFTQLIRDSDRFRAQIAALKSPAAAPKPDPVEVARLADADARVAPLLTQRAEAVVALERENAGAAAPAVVKDLQAKLAIAEKLLAAARETARRDADALLKAADAHRTERAIADLEHNVRVTEATREATRRERDALQKVIASSAADDTNVDAMRAALVPEREFLNKIQAQITEQRIAGDRARVSPRGAATAEPIEAKYRHLWAALAGAGAFVIGFVLATGFQLTGLAVRVLRRFA